MQANIGLVPGRGGRLWSCADTALLCTSGAGWPRALTDRLLVGLCHPAHRELRSDVLLAGGTPQLLWEGFQPMLVVLSRSSPHTSSASLPLLSLHSAITSNMLCRVWPCRKETVAHLLFFEHSQALGTLCSPKDTVTALPSGCPLSFLTAQLMGQVPKPKQDCLWSCQHQVIPDHGSCSRSHCQLEW